MWYVERVFQHIIVTVQYVWIQLTVPFVFCLVIVLRKLQFYSLYLISSFNYLGNIAIISEGMKWQGDNNENGLQTPRYRISGKLACILKLKFVRLPPSWILGFNRYYFFIYISESNELSIYKQRSVKRMCLPVYSCLTSMKFRCFYNSK